jgi:hypothetical protein
MDGFRFAPELFEYRSDTIAALQEAGFDWMSHYSAVDPLHDVYGIEICGIHEEDDAVTILRLMSRLYPSWGVHWMYYKDYGRDLGWKVIVQRDREPPDEQWETA